MRAEDWDWSRTVVDHLDLHASDFHESVRFRSNGAPGDRDYGPG